MVTACGWAKRGDRISICSSLDCFVAIRPNGLSPWSDGPLGNQVSFAAADGGVAQNHVLTHFVIEGRLLNDVIASGLATIRLGRNESVLIKAATARLGLLSIGRPLIGYLFETGQDSSCTVKQMVLVKGENIHLRFVGSPSEEKDIPLKKRCS